MFTIDATTPNYFGNKTANERVSQRTTRNNSATAALTQEQGTGFMIRLTAIALVVGTFGYIGMSMLSWGVAVVR